MHEIMEGKFFNWYRRVENYNDMSKFAMLGGWVINSNGGEIKDITELIGEYPTMDDNKIIDRELTESDLNWIEFAKNNNLEYKITENGIKLGN